MPYPGLLYLEPLPLPQATARPYLCRRPSKDKSVSVSLGPPGAHKVLFEPSKHLWWIWGLIINKNFPLTLSCWGFSFALGCGVSFSSRIQHSPVDGCSAVS